MEKQSFRLNFRHFDFGSFFRFMFNVSDYLIPIVKKSTGLFLYIFFILLFPCFDECDVASETEKYD